MVGVPWWDQDPGSVQMESLREDDIYEMRCVLKSLRKEIRSMSATALVLLFIVAMFDNSYIHILGFKFLLFWC